MSDEFDPSQPFETEDEFDPSQPFEADETVDRDGVKIPMASGAEKKAFEAWAKSNNVRDPYHPDQHYDYVGAFRSGIGRDKESAHFPDTFKLPGHETFSNESQYAKGANADFAGSWDGENYTPGKRRYESREYGLAFQPEPEVANPYAEIGPPSTGVPEESLRPRQRGIIERSARGLLQDLPLKETLGGGIEAIDEKVRGNPEAFIDLYRRFRDKHRRFWDYERTQNKTAGKIAGFVGNIPTAIASTILPGGPIVQGTIMGGLTGLDQSRADLTKGEVGQAALDTGTGAAIGAAASYLIPGLIDAAAHPVQTAGKIAQIPQKIKDATSNVFGGTRVAKWLAGSGDDVADDAFKSARVKDLEATIADATKAVKESVPLPKDDFATRLARAANRGTAELDEAGGFAFDPADFGDDLANMQADVIENMAKKHYPEVDPAEAGRGIAMLDTIKRMSRDKIAAGEAANAQAAKKAGQEALTNPNGRPLRNRPISDTSIGKANQMAKPSGYAKHWLPSKKGTPQAAKIEAEIREAMPNATDDEIRSELMQALYPDSEWGRLKMRQNNFDNSRVAEPQMSPAAAESIRNQAFRKDVSTGIQDEERALIRRAIELREAVKQNDAMAAEKFVTDTAEANRLKSVADSARAELERLTTGNKALGKLFGGLAGAKAGGAIGGIPGAVMGATAGAAGGSKVLQGVDMAGAAGQRLASVSSIVDQLATRGDAVGRMARFALSGDNQSRAVNMAILAEMPEIQELIGNGGTDR